MTIIGKLIAPRSQKPVTARPQEAHTYRAEAIRLVAVARESGLRFQRQWIVSFVAVVGMLALLAALYLNVTASASIAGRQIQGLEVNIATNEQENADLETQIATSVSDNVLEQRAQVMGFMPVDRTKLQYMVVPGYFPAEPANMVSSAAPVEVMANSSAFNETLIDWFSKQFAAASTPLSDVKN